jgi:hypothetical protein
LLFTPLPKRKILFPSANQPLADNNCSITYIDSSFTIQDLCTGVVLGTSRCKDGLHILDRGQKAFLATLQDQNLQPSPDIWHALLSHFFLSCC